MKTRSEKPWYTPMVVAFLCDDVPAILGTSQSCFSRDIITLEKRLAHEGESFFTKTLPAFGKVIDLALQGHVPLATTSFKKCGRSALPAFLSALLRFVFKEDGWVLESPNTDAIKLLRQLCYWCKKIQKGFDDESTQKAAAEFIEIDKALPETSADIASANRHLAVARAIINAVFRDIGDVQNVCPKHGPGAVAGGEGPIGKRALAVSYKDLETVFRPIPWFRSLRDAAEDPHCVIGRPKEQFGLSRLAFVEKDSSGPRIIGLEPAEYMWCQQAVKQLMYAHIEAHRITRGQVNFTDQTINRELAMQWRDFETLDMSKASDRNSMILVRSLFEETRLWPYLSASRTPGVRMPDGSVLYYKKFAPMGSALCFPVQSMVYYALAVAVLHLLGWPLAIASKSVFVYGDDLIVPRGLFSDINAVFSSVGLVFNLSKCCIYGKFRESCGQDAFDGVDVTPARLKPAAMGDDVQKVKVIEHVNALFDLGYWNASAALKRLALADQRIRSWRLRQTSREDLPILTWRCLPGYNTVRYRTKNGVSTVLGWALRPQKAEMDEALEVRYYRESLCHGGPVGQLVAQQTGVGTPNECRRMLALPYSASARLIKQTVVLEY